MKYVVGNLKMNLITPSERERYLTTLKKELFGKKFKNTEIILCPPPVHLENFANDIQGPKISIGAQDVFWEKSGSFTSEISPWMVKNLKAEYTIIGHSERRKYFGETSAMDNLKIKAALKAGLTVIYCIGEKREERDNEMMSDILSIQLEEGLRGINSGFLGKIIIAYEPVWAVGTDVIPTMNEVMEARILIRKILTGMYGPKNGLKSPILYGGSVKQENVGRLCLEPGMDGVLVGRESLIPHEFIKIAEIIDKN
jgi:triosephosphate isomerase (TIM)